MESKIKRIKKTATITLRVHQNLKEAVIDYCNKNAISETELVTNLIKEKIGFGK